MSHFFVSSIKTRKLLFLYYNSSFENNGRASHFQFLFCLLVLAFAFIPTLTPHRRDKYKSQGLISLHLRRYVFIYLLKFIWAYIKYIIYLIDRVPTPDFVFRQPLKSFLTSDSPLQLCWRTRLQCKVISKQSDPIQIYFNSTGEPFLNTN